MRPDCTPLKTCSVCGSTYPATTEHFSPRRDRKIGVMSACRSCMTKRTARYRAARPDRYKADYTRYNTKHRERRAEQAKQRRLDNPERERAHDATWRKNHPEEARAKGRNRHARLASAEGSHTAADVAAQRARQKGRCYWCGVKVGRSYHVDHVVPLARGGSNGPENLVIACARCNCSRGALLPHEWGDRLL